MNDYEFMTQGLKKFNPNSLLKKIKYAIVEVITFIIEIIVI